MALLERDWVAGAKAEAEANKQLNKQAVFIMVTWYSIRIRIWDGVALDRSLRDLATSNSRAQGGCDVRTMQSPDDGSDL